jgi:hypothetical protein
VSGDGSAEFPFIISSGSSATGTVRFTDTGEVDFTVTGSGTTADPYLVSAVLPWVDPLPGNTGDVLTKQADGTWLAGPPATAAAGSVATGPGLTGDGSAGNPIRICLTSYDELKDAVNC